MITRKAPKPGPVSTSVLPLVRCRLCQRTLAHQPKKGAASAVLTAHYNRDHAGELQNLSA